MIRFNKKLYYKYFDLFRICSFLRDSHMESRSLKAMELIKIADKNCVDLSNKNQRIGIELDDFLINDIDEFIESKTIVYIDKYCENVADWVRDIILPDFLDLTQLSSIFSSNNICGREDLIECLSSQTSVDLLGAETAELYQYFIRYTDWSLYPTQYATKYNDLELLERKYLGVDIKGNFHNHTIFSDGVYSIEELSDIAAFYQYEYIGVSDHTMTMCGISDDNIAVQHNVIDKINEINTHKILKSAECEILINGDLDLSIDSLSRLDYTIIAIHKDSNQVRELAEKRLIKAIESPYANILAHPSGRLYKRKVGLCVDMFKIIDACVANRVAIEINGDPDRLDLDPQYIRYAVDKGAMFTLDSDTHLQNSFKNINNAIHIACDYNIPIEQCLNIKSYSDLISFFRK